MKRTKTKENRKFFRHPLSAPIVCHRKGHMEPRAAELRNISRGGLAFVSGDAYDNGDIVTVDYPTLRSRSLLGEVVWVEPLGTGLDTRYTYGIRFLDEETFRRARIVEQICRIEVYRQTQAEKHGIELSAGEAAEQWIATTAKRFPR